MEKMEVYTYLFYVCILVSILKGTDAQLDITAVYNLLSGKFDTVNIEMTILRNELFQTKADLMTTKSELRDVKKELASYKSGDSPISSPRTIPPKSTNIPMAHVLQYQRLASVVRKTLAQEKRHIRDAMAKKNSKLHHQFLDTIRAVENVSKMENKMHQQLDDVSVALTEQRKRVDGLTHTLQQCLNCSSQINKLDLRLETHTIQLNGQVKKIGNVEIAIERMNNELVVLKTSLEGNDNQMQAVRNDILSNKGSTARLASKTSLMESEQLELKTSLEQTASRIETIDSRLTTLSQPSPLHHQNARQYGYWQSQPDRRPSLRKRLPSKSHYEVYDGDHLNWRNSKETS